MYALQSLWTMARERLDKLSGKAEGVAFDPELEAAMDVANKAVFGAETLRDMTAGMMYEERGHATYHFICVGCVYEEAAIVGGGSGGTVPPAKATGDRMWVQWYHGVTEEQVVPRWACV